MMAKKPSIKEINDSEKDLLNRLTSKQIILFVDKEYSEVLDSFLKRDYASYNDKHIQFNQYWRFFTSDDIYKSESFYRGLGTAYHKKFHQKHFELYELKPIISLTKKVNLMIHRFMNDLKMLVSILFDLFIAIESDTDLENNKFIQGYNNIIEELFASLSLNKMDIDNLLPIIIDYDFAFLEISPQMIEHMGFKENAEKVDDFKEFYNIFIESVVDNLLDDIYPIYDKVSQDGFSSMKMELGIKQDLFYDMENFKVKRICEESKE